jgi:hypothetical protein
VVYAVQASFEFRNTARRDGVAGNVQTRLAQTVRWGETVVSKGTSDAGADVMLFVTVRFTTRAEQEAFWNDALAFIGTGINGPVVGSAMWRHDCPHDQAMPAACVEALRQEW